MSSADEALRLADELEKLARAGARVQASDMDRVAEVAVGLKVVEAAAKRADVGLQQGGNVTPIVPTTSISGGSPKPASGLGKVYGAKALSQPLGGTSVAAATSTFTSGMPATKTAEEKDANFGKLVGKGIQAVGKHLGPEAQMLAGRGAQKVQRGAKLTQQFMKDKPYTSLALAGGAGYLGGKTVLGSAASGLGRIVLAQKIMEELE